MKKILFIFFLNLSIGFVQAQEEASNWYFGDNAGIHFNPDGTVTSVNGGQLSTREGCSSISDSNGDLLFYTDGSVVYNRNHTIMTNGAGLLGDASSTQSAIVVPKPFDPDIYYIFTVGSNLNPNGLKYSVVDMTQSGGLGAIIQKNANLLNDSSEKISAVLKDCDSQEVWVIALGNDSGFHGNWNTYYAYLVTDLGVNPTPVTSFHPLNINDSRGYLKFSPDGTKLASANMDEGLFLFDFDTQTGQVTNPVQLFINQPENQPYGIEFSPNNNLLYVTASNDYFAMDGSDQIPANHQSVLVQFDLTATNIVGSQVLIDSRSLYRGGLQLGPNGKIYRALSATYDSGLSFLGAINNPNLVGLACDYQNNAVSLAPNRSTQGLPPFIQSFFNQKVDIINNGNISSTYLPLCDGDTYILSIADVPGATYTWTFDGNILPNNTHSLTVSQPGLYEVIADLNTGECETLEGEALVEYFEYPVASTPQDARFCDDDNDGTWTFSLSQFDNEAIGTLDPLDYTAHYFESYDDAFNNVNELNTTYTNTSNPQQLFVRVSNVNNSNCFDITSFNVEIFDTPNIPEIAPLILCDDGTDGDDTNGQMTIDLTQFNTVALNGLNPAEFTVSYHTNAVDANDSASSLSLNYYNANPIQDTVFVRVENNLHPECFDVGSIDITVNPIPLGNDVTLIQCDEDGANDGKTTFNIEQVFDDLTVSATNRSIKVYTSMANLLNDTNPIPTDAYQNTSNPQPLQVKIIDDQTQCYRVVQLTLEVSTTQIDAYTAPPVCDELGSEDGINTFDLETIKNEMLSGLPPTIDLSFYGTYNDALLEVDPIQTPFENTVPYHQVLYARAENANACYGISEVTFTVNPLPQVMEDELFYYCLNTYPETLTLSSGNMDSQLSNDTYLWSTGDTTESIEVNQPGSYTVEITNSYGCTKERTITVEASNIATFENIQILDGSESFNNVVTVLVSGEGIYEYALWNEEGPVAYFQESNIFENVPPGILTVQVTDVKNDCGLVEQVISVIGFPKFFTPNNDGYNDTWQVYGISNQFQPHSKILIFDRYGKLLKQLDPLGKGWDGIFNGALLPSDDYWFAVTLEDGRVFKSHFALKR